MDDDKYSDIKRKEKNEINNVATAMVIGVSLIIALAYMYYNRGMEGLFITLIYSLLGNFLFKWRINHEEGNMALNRGLKKGFFFWLFTGLIPPILLIILIGSCSLGGLSNGL